MDCYIRPVSGSWDMGYCLGGPRREVIEKRIGGRSSIGPKEAGLYASTAALRVVGGDKKGMQCLGA
jgi:hypothetical protein